MDWFHWVMVAFGIFFAISTPFMVAKAVRRKEWQDVFENITFTLWTLGLVLDTVSPAFIHDVWPLLRWLWLLSSLLMLANVFGFSGRLFNRRRMQKI